MSRLGGPPPHRRSRNVDAGIYGLILGSSIVAAASVEHPDRPGIVEAYLCVTAVVFFLAHARLRARHRSLDRRGGPKRCVGATRAEAGVADGQRSAAAGSGPAAWSAARPTAAGGDDDRARPRVERAVCGGWLRLPARPAQRRRRRRSPFSSRPLSPERSSRSRSSSTAEAARSRRKAERGPATPLGQKRAQPYRPQASSLTFARSNSSDESAPFSLSSFSLCSSSAGELWACSRM